MLCQPLMEHNGGLAHTPLGRLIGTGAGRGISLWFIVLGVFMSAMALLVYRFSSVSKLDSSANTAKDPLKSQ